MLDYLNDNPGLVAVVSAISGLVGVVLGWGLNIVSDSIKHNRLKKEEEEKEQRERFKNKARFAMSNKFDAREEQVSQKVSVVLCSYEAEMKNGVVKIRYPKGLLKADNLKYEHFYFKNIGKSDMYDFEVAVESPENQAILKRDFYTKYIKGGLISYGVSSARMLRKGEIVRLTVYYSEYDPIINMFEASLLLFYRDELNNVCEQPIFPMQNNIYEPTLISQKDWREHISIDKNLEYWKDRLKLVGKK